MSSFRSLIRLIIAILSFVALWACQAAKTQPVDFGVVKMQADAGWRVETPASGMRKAQFTLPRVSGDAEDADLVVFYFGADQGGTVEANLKRWYTQFAQPDSSVSSEKAKVSTDEVAGMNLTTVDLSGTYVAPVTPGASERHNKPDFRMLAAVLETSEGPYFFKLVGPEKTVANWAASFHAFMKSAKS